MSYVKCEHCKGKGYVWDYMAFVMLTVVAPLAYLLARNEEPTENGPKEICYKCGGKGYIRI